LWAIKKIYNEVGNSGVKISIIGIGRHDYLKEHTEIFNAIKNKDSKDARKRMQDHLAEVEKDLLSD